MNKNKVKYYPNRDNIPFGLVYERGLGSSEYIQPQHYVFVNVFVKTENTPPEIEPMKVYDEENYEKHSR
jgi:hypothetical protein